MNLVCGKGGKKRLFFLGGLLRSSSSPEFDAKETLFTNKSCITKENKIKGKRVGMKATE